MNDHERIEELIAVRAFGGLDPDGERDLIRARADHDLDCPDCLRLETEYEEVAGRLAFALEPAPVREGLEQEVASRAFGPGAERPRAGWPRRVLAIAAAAVLLLLAGVAGYLVAPGSNPEAVAVSSFLSQPGARLVRFHGGGPGNLALAYRPGERSAYVLGSHVQSPPAGKVYELWLLYGSTGHSPSPAGTFEGQSGLLILHVRADPARARMVGVTVEKAPGVDQPTAAPIWTAPVSA